VQDTALQNGVVREGSVTPGRRRGTRHAMPLRAIEDPSVAARDRLY
jgi:hypothetical protein